VNEVRSRTAENIYGSDGKYQVRSAGTMKDARVRVRSEMIRWADIIFVMEDHHDHFIRRNFAPEIGHREIITLDISDDYYYMEPALVGLIREKTAPYLDDQG